jgi:hypothetical protein
MTSGILEFKSIIVLPLMSLSQTTTFEGEEVTGEGITLISNELIPAQPVLLSPILV